MERRTAIGAAVGVAVTAVGALLAGLLAGGEGSGEAASTTTRPTRRTTTSKATTTSTSKPRRSHRSTTTTTTGNPGQPGDPTPTTQVPATTTTQGVLVWPQIARVADVPVGGAKTFTFRGASSYAGSPGILLQPAAGSFIAYGPCTHQFGPLKLDGAALVCQWHGSRFAASDGSVQSGPATDPLGHVVLQVSGGVVSYVSDTI